MINSRLGISPWTNLNCFVSPMLPGLEPFLGIAVKEFEAEDNLCKNCFYLDNILPDMMTL